MPGTADNSAAEELGELVRSLRAYLHWQQENGALGLPAASGELRATRGAPEFSQGDARPRVAATPFVQGVPTNPRQPAPLSHPTPLNHPAPSRQPASPSSPPIQKALGAPEQKPSALVPQLPTVLAPARPLAAVRLAGLSTDSIRRLEVLAREVASCTRCGLHTERTQTVFARGNGSSGLCFVGEGPGADEDAQGFPFVGAAGQLLDKMIEAMGLARDDVYVCNVVKCRPPKNRKPEPEEMRTCMPYLAEQLELLHPQAIVALGATAVQGLLGTTEGITRMRGTWRLYRGRIAVMPTFHPAYLLRQPSAKRLVWQDLQEVLKHLGRSLPSR